ncbi:unnamed protein product, partial [Mesorhabditis spiculigera]
MGDSVRIRRSSKDSKVNLVYEVILNPDDPDPAELYFQQGDAFELRCLVESDSFDVDTLNFESGPTKLEAVKENNWLSVNVDSFKTGDHGGGVRCEVQEKAGPSVFTKPITLKEKVSIKNGMLACPPSSQKVCYNGGVCVLEKKLERCFCAGNFGGETCDTPIIFEGSRTEQIAMGTGGTLMLIFLALSLVFGLLFYKERRKRRALLDYMEHSMPTSPSSDGIYEGRFENPYKEIANHKRLSMKRSETEESWIRRSIRRMRGYNATESPQQENRPMVHTAPPKQQPPIT